MRGHRAVIARYDLWVMTVNERAMVLPLDADAALFHWNGETLRQCPAVKVPRAAPWAASIEADLLCYADARTLHTIRGAFTGEVTRERVVHAPSNDYRFDALALKDGVLFAGGHCRDEILGFVDLESDEPAWTPLFVPPELKSFGKSVDAFVLDGDRLLGMDDILLPKWWLVYDVSEARRARFVDNPTLPPNSTYETFISAALSHRFVVAASTSMNHGNTSVHLSFFDRVTLASLGAVSAPAGPLTRRGSATRAESRDFVHVDAHDEMLAICAGNEGCGLIDLRSIEALAPPAASNSRLAPVNQPLRAAIASNTRWCKREGGAAVRAYFCGHGKVAVSWQRPDGGCWVELVKVES